ncbi:MAG: NAD-binding protein, partial [Hyphomicrobium sp.]|nr:NAD-binding protein [Hyphomicrobium sp.]
AAKICNNMMMAICMFGACEGFALGEKLGISHQTLFDVVSTSTGNSFALSGYCPVPGPVSTTPANRDYAPGFMTKLMVKDLMLAQQASQESGVSTPMGALAQSQLRLYMNMVEGAADKDFSSVMNFVRGKIG